MLNPSVHKSFVVHFGGYVGECWNVLNFYSAVRLSYTRTSQVPKSRAIFTPGLLGITMLAFVYLRNHPLDLQRITSHKFSVAHGAHMHIASLVTAI
ncbi:hypothetical protein BDV39DRAFT_157767 [Aspergillus sergii]|uniref:Uncharacterized protein n=1 Tax=Aspergillus sergii TaxID=1034303 RepID=A0A5N6XJ53_9EURO|nr:hypothetical protein BDV39DRAFT_157767 [Aspergillus sergii]